MEWLAGTIAFEPEPNSVGKNRVGLSGRQLHRLLTNFTAASEGITTDTVISRLIEETPTREGELQKDERFKKIFAT